MDMIGHDHIPPYNPSFTQRPPLFQMLVDLIIVQNFFSIFRAHYYINNNRAISYIQNRRVGRALPLGDFFFSLIHAFVVQDDTEVVPPIF